jgi:hypothetical protein
VPESRAVIAPGCSEGSAPTKPRARAELKKPPEGGQTATIAPVFGPGRPTKSGAGGSMSLRVSENPQSVNGRVRLEFPRRPSENRS